jgi:Rps23 Pro-64 3,4-dihydroxylase Tpa1-like proline 4-hydroxylase
MTPKQILDSFSSTLMQDERILSAQERALLSALLQHAKTATTENPETREAVRAVIASAVGETAAQRAFAVLGESIVQRILGGNALSVTQSLAEMKTDPQPPRGAPMPPDPQPPRGAPMPPDPQPPRAPMPHKPPHHKHPESPQPPRSAPIPPDPQPPRGATERTVIAETKAAILERPVQLPARCVVLDEFLAPQELEKLTQFTLEHAADFSISEVVSPQADGGVVNYEHRRSRVLMDLGKHQNVILERIKAVLPQVLEKLGMEEFSIAGVEAQITASNDGDFFGFHSDNSSDPVASRNLTFVYFFQKEPKQFQGGELRIHDAHLEGEHYVSEGSFQTIVPQQNQIVFFPCELLHEITPVKCPSQVFADGRFTLNGWLRR